MLCLMLGTQLAKPLATEQNKSDSRGLGGHGKPAAAGFF
jgi:hypothetical protein